MGNIGKICKKDDWLLGTHSFTDFTFHAAAICFRFYALLDRLNVLEWSCTCAHSKCIRPPWPCLATHSGCKGLISAENKFTRSNFTIFSKQVSADSQSFQFQLYHGLHIQNFANYFRHKYDPSISQFFKASFSRFTKLLFSVIPCALRSKFDK